MAYPRLLPLDPFVIYIVDVTKPQGPDVVPPPAAHPDYPAPPPNAIAITHHGSHIPIYYNQTIVLQCLTSGVVSPVLIIRKVERDTTVVGGGLQEGAKGVPDHFCALGEVCGDPVSQLHKVAFEVYDPNKAAPAPGSAGSTGAFLSCMGDKVNTYRPPDGRTWNYSEVSSRSQSPAIPDSPGASSNGSVTDYFSNSSPLDGSSMDGHGLPPSSDGGRVHSRRGAKRSNTTSSGPVPKTTSKARRRVNSVGSNGSGGGYASSSTRYGLTDQSMASGALWSIDIGESAVWTIVGTGALVDIILVPVEDGSQELVSTEQIRYNFFVPPGMPGSRASGVPLKPVTPFPNIGMCTRRPV
jgi:recombining binding protein suppressor of hairless